MLASRLLLYNVVEFATCTYVSEGINITNGEEEEVFLKDTDNITKKKFWRAIFGNSHDEFNVKSKRLIKTLLGNNDDGQMATTPYITDSENIPPIKKKFPNQTNISTWKTI